MPSRRNQLFAVSLPILSAVVAIGLALLVPSTAHSLPSAPDAGHSPAAEADTVPLVVRTNGSVWADAPEGRFEVRNGSVEIGSDGRASCVHVSGGRRVAVVPEGAVVHSQRRYVGKRVLVSWRCSPAYRATRIDAFGESVEKLAPSIRAEGERVDGGVSLASTSDLQIGVGADRYIRYATDATGGRFRTVRLAPGVCAVDFTVGAPGKHAQLGNVKATRHKLCIQ